MRESPHESARARTCTKRDTSGLPAPGVRRGMVRVRPGMVAAARPRAVQAVRHRRLATLWARRARAGRDEAARRGAAHRPAGGLPQRIVPVSAKEHTGVRASSEGSATTNRRVDLSTLWARRARAGRDETARRGAAHRPAGELPQRVVPVSPAAGSDALTTVSDNGVAGVSSKAGRSKRHPRVSERHIVPNVHQNSTIATSATLNSTCSTSR